MRRKRRLSRCVLGAASVGLAVGGLVLAAASPAPAPAGASAGGGVLRLGWPSDLRLDPALGYDVFSWAVEYATCAKLFNYPDRPGETGAQVSPEVVQESEVSADGRTYTFVLKRTFRFQSGERVTAASFAAAFNRDADPKLKSPAVGYLREVVGANAVIAGTARTIAGVRVLGAYQLQIRLTRPLGDLTVRLAMPLFCPVPPGTPRHELGLPPGSGPYYVAEHVPDRRVVLRRNRYYRGGRPVRVDEIDFALGVQRPDCVAAVEQTQLDVCVLTSADPNRALAEKYGINRPGGRYFVLPTLSTWYLAFNHDRPAFRGPGQIPLAKAINYAIDHPALARAYGYLGARRTDHILPPVLGGSSHYYPIRGADPTTARKWLAKARYKPDKLVLYTYSEPSAVAVAGVLAYDLRELGIELDIKYFSFGAMWQKSGVRGEPFDIVVRYWGADYPDPVSFFRPLLHSASLQQSLNNNVSYFHDAKVDAAIDAADRLTGSARRDAFAALDTTLMRDNPPWAPYANYNERAFVSQDVGCVLMQPIYGFDIATACRK